MATDRLYYDQTYLREFDARTEEVRQDGDNWLVSLDRSAFYPTSGGQPFDTGRLITQTAETAVTEVSVDRNGIVWHRLPVPLKPGETVHGVIDWPRRFDHMQQHGGEHMLAGAVWELLRGVTQGLHLGVEDSSIDVELPDGVSHVSAEMIRTLEELVNSWIQHDDPVRCWFPKPEELAALPLRKPPTVTEHIRIVAMGDYEMIACGGTHPARTGEIGLMHILSVTPVRGKARFTFVCGARAVRHYRLCADITDALSARLSVPPEGLTCAVDRQKDQIAELKARLKSLEEESWRRELSEQLRQEQGIAVLYRENGDPDAMTDAVTRLIREPGRVILAGVGKRLIMGRSADRTIDLVRVIRQTARGGGRPELVTGAGGPAELEKAAALIRGDL